MDGSRHQSGSTQGGHTVRLAQRDCGSWRLREGSSTLALLTTWGGGTVSCRTILSSTMPSTYGMLTASYPLPTPEAEPSKNVYGCRQMSVARKMPQLRAAASGQVKKWWQIMFLSC